MALFLSAFFLSGIAYGQNDPIRLVFAEDVQDSEEHEKTTVAKGHVEFAHAGNRLFCDSALFFQKKNLVHAYGNIQINQGDTVNLFCDSLKYDGQTKISKLQGNVRFRDNEYLMVTDSLEYNSARSVGYYTNHAVITSINSSLQLTSVKGYYYSNTKTFFFKDSVHLTDEKYELFSDTLEFRTNTSSAHFHGPTTILFDSSRVECEKGIYESAKDSIQLWNGATFFETGRTFYADSLLYGQVSGIGEGFCNVRLYDSTENVQFLSDYLFKTENNESVIMKKAARIYQYGEKDTLFLAGDTISYFKDTVTNNQTSIIENNVNIINGELFIRADSAYFSEQDSILKLHREPMVWNKNSQMTADSIFATYYDKAFHEMTLYDNAIIVSEHEGDSVHYDQIKGKYMTAYLDSNIIQKVWIQNNAQTLYYPEEEQKQPDSTVTKTLSGMNLIDCVEIVVRFKEGDINSILFNEQPTSIFYPMDQIPPKKMYLKGFSWQIERKPDRPYPEL